MTDADSVAAGEGDEVVGVEVEFRKGVEEDSDFEVRTGREAVQMRFGQI